MPEASREPLGAIRMVLTAVFNANVSIPHRPT